MMFQFVWILTEDWANLLAGLRNKFVLNLYVLKVLTYIVPDLRKPVDCKMGHSFRKF